MTMSIVNFETFDELAYYNALDPYALLSSLSLSDVERFIRSLGVEIEVKEDYLILPTVCHNPLEEAHNKKLYYYQDSHSFHCFTECEDNFNLIGFYQKFADLNYEEALSYEQAGDYIKNFFSEELATITLPEKEVIPPYEPLAFYDRMPQLKAYNENVLSMFSRFLHPSWRKLGLTQETLDIFNIRFSSLYNKIVIPHYDIHSRLVGVRVRNLNPEDVEYAKYMPLIVGGQTYTHPLTYNLYGIAENQEAIKVARKAIIFEGEKSVLLMKQYYKEDCIAVASCGNKLNRHQVELLRSLGVNEIVLAYDKEYVKIFDKDFTKWTTHLSKLGEKYQNFAHFSYIIDDLGLLDLKDSPVDKGKDIFETLYKKCKVKVN